MLLQIIKLLYYFIAIATFIFETMLLIDLGERAKLPRRIIVRTVLQGIFPTLCISLCPIINLMILIITLTSWDVIIDASLHEVRDRYHTGGKNE